MRYPTSAKLFEIAKTIIPGGVNSPVRAFRNVGGDPFFVRRAKGSRIEDIDGKSYIDYIGTWGPAILGHAPMSVINAVHEAAKNGLSFGIPNVLEVEMAQMITSWVPSVEKVRMTNSGTEATMSAIRLARGYTKRDKIIKFDGCYHGHSDSLLVAAGSGALTHGEPDSAGVPAAFAAETIVLPFNDPAAVEAAFLQWEGQIAALILEPYPANAGLILPQPGFLSFLREITERNGTVLIFDEASLGLDVVVARALQSIVLDLRDQGKCIIYSTHIMREVERLCDHVAIMYKGKLIDTGTLEELADRHEQNDFEELFFQLLTKGDKGHFHTKPPIGIGMRTLTASASSQSGAL